MVNERGIDISCTNERMLLSYFSPMVALGYIFRGPIRRCILGKK